MPLVEGVSFKPAGRIYSFDPAGLELKPGATIVAETSRGLEVGIVKQGPKEVPDSQVVAPLKSVLRVANETDRAQIESNEARAETALGLCRERVASRGLPMKLLRAEYAFDRSQ